MERRSARTLRNPRPHILVFADHYLPGWKAGGPIRSLSNMVAELGDEFDFRIITRDRDHTDTAPYVGVPLDEWVEVGKAKVFYARPTALELRRLRSLIRSCKPELVFLRSFHSPLTIKYLALRQLSRGMRFPTLIAPQGEFAPAALSIKKTKKRAYLGVVWLTCLARGVHWQVSSAAEEAAVLGRFPAAHTHVVPDLPRRPLPHPTAPQVKTP